MEPNRVEFQKQCIFQSFCKRVLHNEACNAHEEIRRRRAKEVSFSDLALHEERQLYTLDKYFQDEEAEPSYQQAGKKITPKLLLEAIRTLPEEKRKAIPVFPMLKTVEQMSKISGIGENKLRELMDSGELEYIQNGNRRLIADAAIWDWYHRAKTTAKPPARQGG